MASPLSRPSLSAPPQLKALLTAVEASLHPTEIWLFGSRARGDHGSDSDWDLLAVVPDDAPEQATDPLIVWEIKRASGVPATLLATKRSELEALWGVPNTIGYDLAREGVRLLVGE